jgi:transcriptional regulator with XRE-family HTH domain
VLTKLDHTLSPGGSAGGGREDVTRMTDKPSSDLAHPVDLYVGARLRIRRKVLGLSQTQLAEALGITFQQIQKYERGANRISASKLYEAARLLQSPVSYFFEGLDETTQGAVDDGFAQRMTQFVATPEGLELAGLFPRLNDRRLRRRVVELVKAMVDDETGALAP